MVTLTGTQRPEIERLVALVVKQHFGSHILWRANKCELVLGVGLLAALGQPEVRDANVAVLVDEHILGFEALLRAALLAVDDVLVVHELQGQEDLRGVELGPALLMSLLLFCELLFADQ